MIRMKRVRLRYLSVFLMIPLFVGFGFFVASERSLSKNLESSSVQPLEIIKEAVPLEQAYPYEVAPRSSLYLTLRELNVAPSVIHQVVEAAKPFANLASIKPGTRFQVIRQDDNSTEPTEINFRFSAIERLEVVKGIDGWVAHQVEQQVDSRVVTFRGVVKTTLWDSAITAQMDPSLTSELAEIFAWQVDFAREVRVNDRWRLSVEQKLVDGKPFGWGKILAAEYKNADDLYQAVLLRDGDKDVGYFAPDGSSLRRMFLKSPIQFARISSRFHKRRFHPILKVNRPHLGVDYAAPVGTPIRSVGDGVVTIAAWRGGGGNTIMVRHNSVYKTAYKHLSGYAKGIRSGSKVRQGQIIGYVGSTGMSTGPHLHFEFYKSGSYVDPLGQKFPSADPVPSDLLPQFKNASPLALASLPEWDKEDPLRALSSESF